MVVYPTVQAVKDRILLFVSQVSAKEAKWPGAGVARRALQDALDELITEFPGFWHTDQTKPRSPLVLDGTSDMKALPDDLMRFESFQPSSTYRHLHVRVFNEDEGQEYAHAVMQTEQSETSELLLRVNGRTLLYHPVRTVQGWLTYIKRVTVPTVETESVYLPPSALVTVVKYAASLIKWPDLSPSDARALYEEAMAALDRAGMRKLVLERKDDPSMVESSRTQ